MKIYIAPSFRLREETSLKKPNSDMTFMSMINVCKPQIVHVQENILICAGIVITFSELGRVGSYDKHRKEVFIYV